MKLNFRIYQDNKRIIFIKTALLKDIYNLFFLNGAKNTQTL